MHITPLKLKAQLLYLSGGAVWTLALSVVGLRAWWTTLIFQPPGKDNDRSGQYNAAGLLGFITFFTFAGLSIALLFESSQCFMRFAFHPTHTGREWLVCQHAAIGAQVVLGLLFLFTGVVSFVRWSLNSLRCGILFCISVEEHPFETVVPGESFDMFLSTIILVTLVPLACVMWYRVYTLQQLRRAVRAVATSALEDPVGGASNDMGRGARLGLENDSGAFAGFVDNSAPFQGVEGCSLKATLANPMAKPASMRLYKAMSWKKQLSRLIGLCAGIVGYAVLSFWLPNDYRKASASGIANYARQSISRERKQSNTTVPEMPYAWFRTGQIRLSPGLVLKLYPGNVFFYVYLLSAVVMVFVLRQTQTGRYWMQRRIPRCVCFTYGEAAFTAATAWLTLFFFFYWLHDHNYKVGWTVDNPVKMKVKSAERWGRALGQLAILFLSLLLLPVGRQSVVVTVLGVSRDGLLWFHRAVGYCMLAATLGHVIAFYVSFYQYGLLWHNLLFLPITIGQAAVVNDFTVVAATWTTWFLLIAMGIFGLNAVRRRYYELFYYTHLAATYMTLPMMLFHASAGWMYMLPGLTVFLADQLVRVWQRSAVVRVVHARTISEDTVELAFSVPGRWDMRRVHPGQYVLVCVPELTALQWHPFTLTNVVDNVEGEACGCADPGVAVSTTGTVFYLHIKSMGRLTWTGRLYDMVRSGQVFSMGVEGPCGTPVDYSRYDDIVLVAGGIGAAPCVSVYGSLLRAYLRSAGGVGVPRVRMVWSTRSASLVGAVADMLQLPVSYRSLVWQPKKRVGGSGKAGRTPTARLSASGDQQGAAVVEVAACEKVRNDDFTLDVYVTCAGELERFVALQDGTHKANAGAADAVVVLSGGDDAKHPPANGISEAREVAEELSEVSAARQSATASETTSRGARLRVFEGRPDLVRVIRSAFLSTVTDTVEGDVTRKLVLVCGPEGMVADVMAAAADLGVAVHTEDFLF